MKVKSESDVAQSCLTLSDPMDCSPPGSSAHGIFQARVLEWGASAFSLDQSYPLRNARVRNPEIVLFTTVLCDLSDKSKSNSRYRL